jgi:hypothetical protein
MYTAKNAIEGRHRPHESNCDIRNVHGATG